MYYVYILWSTKLSKRYIGSTAQIEKRLMEHNHGNNKFTKGGTPWIKIYQEEYTTKAEALKRERFLKSGQGRKLLDEKLKDIWKGAGVV